MADDSARVFMDELRQRGRSSPAGRYWHDFTVAIGQRAQLGDDSRPPPPLILAASGASNASKFQRLSEQLEWAERHGVLTEALVFLGGLSEEQWTTGSVEDWDQSNWP
jgi:hypothetical protein